MTIDNNKDTTEVFGEEVPNKEIPTAIDIREKILAACENFMSVTIEAQSKIKSLVISHKDTDLDRFCKKILWDWRDANETDLKSLSDWFDGNKQTKVIGVDETKIAIETHVRLKAEHYDKSKRLNTDESWVYAIYIACCKLLYETITDELSKLKQAGAKATVEVALGNIYIDIYYYTKYVKADFRKREVDLNVKDLKGSIIAILVNDRWLLNETPITYRPTLLPWAVGTPGWEDEENSNKLHDHVIITAYKEYPDDPVARLEFLRELNSRKG
jgi:hypothetical protein